MAIYARESGDDDLADPDGGSDQQTEGKTPQPQSTKPQEQSVAQRQIQPKEGKDE